MRRMMRVALLALAVSSVCSQATAQQTLRVGLQDAEPGVIRGDGKLSGRDIDIWNAIASDSGVNVSYVFMSDIASLVSALDAGTIDAVGWGMSRTPATEAKYLLTEPIMESAEAVVVPQEDGRTYRNLDDIRTLRLATLGATVYANHLKDNRIPSVQEFSSVADVVRAVSSGQADGAMFSALIAGYMFKHGDLPGLRVATTYQPALSRPILAAFSKAASAPFDRANASLKKLIADGTIKNVRARYGL